MQLQSYYIQQEKKICIAYADASFAIKENIGNTAWCVARVSDRLNDKRFNEDFMEALKSYKITLDSTLATNPFEYLEACNLGNRMEYSGICPETLLSGDKIS